MSTKKPQSTAKTTEPKPKYGIGAKGFVIIYHKGKPEEILEVKVWQRIVKDQDLKDYGGKKVGVIMNFSYLVDTHQSRMDLLESEIHPTFQSAANKFAEAFTHLLK